MFRTGIGFDAHTLAEGLPLVIGGVRIPHSRGLLGHSDADVLVHAVMDAILGALALGDIGEHFPDTEDEFEGADSLELLSRVQKMIEDKGYCCENLDSIIIAEKPKLKSYIGEMRENIASVLKINIDQLSIKATTTEHMGFTGREEGIVAQAIVLLKLNN
ncbi:MAG: 2-C-methyl-D-erythritol 2,4-cyclodiphosphate synthase [SAR324 cluster bacterium]|jgi:2-C-methyl-D-erythritol 2,4-cyclodiphosphate synthase|nr:2-C-methyl-D-erythritol 2,4-cyclodiphosphate synthase [SAR324 cluster bacterium]